MHNSPFDVVALPADLKDGSQQDDHSTLACVVRDLSNHGARLQLTSTADLPDEFDLTFDTGHTLRKCRVAWQTLTNVGVSFE
jgi:hypothetical protein